MSFTFHCPNCNHAIKAVDEWIGMEAECPNCHQTITIFKPENELKETDDANGKEDGAAQNEAGSAKTQPSPTPEAEQSAAPKVENETKITQKPNIQIGNLYDNPNLVKIAELGCFSVFEHQQDLSNNDPQSAVFSYFMSKMNVRKRQVFIELDGNSIKTQAGAMQFVAGNIDCETGLGSGASAVGRFLKGAIKGMVTGESAVKPLYSGYGCIMLEPTYKFVLLEDVASWGPEGVVLQDTLFLACDASLNEKVVSRKKLSALLAGEGFFSLALSGNGVAVLESPVPREEMYEFELKDDELKIDGNMAIAWSGSLNLTVERSSKTLIGSLVNGEGLVNVYRGTGKVLMAPTVEGTLMDGGWPSGSLRSGGSAAKGVLDGISKMVSK